MVGCVLDFMVICKLVMLCFGVLEYVGGCVLCWVVDMSNRCNLGYLSLGCMVGFCSGMMCRL